MASANPAADLSAKANGGTVGAVTVRDPTAPLRALLMDDGIGLDYPEAVDTEVAAWVAASGIEDPTLEDRTALPFVTVDGPGTRDLDQALFVERRGAGFGVQYAIADASHFVPVGSALFDEALRRGASYYLPGESVPMLPRALSEGLVSLGPGVDRRAMVFDMTLDVDGTCTNTEIVRARIRSRHQLTFTEVEALVHGRGGHPVREPALGASLRCMRTVGALRAEGAAARGVVPYHRTEVSVRLADGGSAGFTAVEVSRTHVEADNAQLSLLCNAEGARVLKDRAGRHGQPIYKVHPPPKPERLEALAACIEATVDAHGLDRRFVWDPAAQTLAAYVRALPDDPAHARVVAAIGRQTIMVNVRSTFDEKPGRHYGVGADVYGRFSAPMREVVGVFLHKEMFEAIAQTGRPPAEDEALRQRVIEAANRAKQLQGTLSAAADQAVIDDLFARSLDQPNKARTVHPGTVMGMRRGRVYVRLDDPPLDIKVYSDRLPRGYEVDEARASLIRDGRRVCRLGDAVGVAVRSRADDGRWVLELTD